MPKEKISTLYVQYNAKTATALLRTNTKHKNTKIQRKMSDYVTFPINHQISHVFFKKIQRRDSPLHHDRRVLLSHSLDIFLRQQFVCPQVVSPMFEASHRRNSFAILKDSRSSATPFSHIHLMCLDQTSANMHLSNLLTSSTFSDYTW